MLYRRKKNIVDPTRINNYNKFLTTLDRTSTIPTIFTTKNYANLLSSINNKTHKDNHSSENITTLSNECDFKNAINKRRSETFCKILNIVTKVNIILECIK